VVVTVPKKGDLAIINGSKKREGRA